MATQKKKLLPSEEIKNYSLKEGSYSITVKVLEGNDIIPKNKGIFGFGASQLVTSQVEIEVYKKKKKSKIIKEQANPVYNQGWTFYFKSLKLDELQDITIKFTVLDRSSSLYTQVIGCYEMDLTSVYFQLNHEYFHTWLTLTDPEDEIEGPTGYLFVNVSVLGPNDEPVIHDIENAKKATSGKEKALVPGKIEQTGHQIEINIYRAENLPCLDSNLNGIDAYVVAKFGGVIAKTKVVLSRNPEWNECIRLQCMLPSQSKYLTIALYDQDFGSDDDLVGQLKLNLADIQYKPHVPKWGNLYGSPSTVDGKAADLMNFYGATQGSHYRGRLLYSCSSYNKKEPKTTTKPLNFSFPHNPIPQTKMRSYLLWVDILEGNEIPDKSSEVIVHVSIGPYMLYTKPKQNLSGQVNWFESLEERKVIFPEDIEQVPDIIFYVADSNREDRRMSFNRIKASKILRSQNAFNPAVDHETVLVELKEDRSLDLVKDDEFPGFLITKVSLLNFRPTQERQYLTEQQQLKNIQDLAEYQLRVQIYQGRGLPPADETGGCDPFVKVKCAGRVGTSKAKVKTLNPGWFESVNLEKVSLPSMKSLMETKYPTKGMFLTVYDCDDSSSERAGGGIGGELNGMMTTIDNKLNFTKNIINTIYSKVANKPLDSSGNLESPSGMNESKMSLLSKSRIQGNNGLLAATMTTPRDAQESGVNKSLNDSGILIADPDKIEKDLLGRIWIPLEASHIKFSVKNSQTPSADAQFFDILYRRPKWYPIKYDATGEYTGQVLLSYTLIPQAYSDVIKSKPTLFPTFEYKVVSFFLIGVREIDEESLGKRLTKICTSLDVSGDSEKATKTDEMKVSNGGSNANQYVELRIQVPKNKSFDPVVDVFLWDCSRSEPYEFLGYGSLSFKDIPFLKYQKNFEEIDDLQSEMSLVDCLKEAIYLEKKMTKEADEQEVVKDLDEVAIDKKNRVIFKRDEDINDNDQNNFPMNPQYKDSSAHGAVNLQDQYVERKMLVDEIEEEPSEEILDENNSIEAKLLRSQKPAETMDIHIVDVKEKMFDRADIHISRAYDNNDENLADQRLIANLPERGPLDLTKRNNQPGRIIDLQDKDTLKNNEFFMNQPPISNSNNQLLKQPMTDRNQVASSNGNYQTSDHDIQTNGTHPSGMDGDHLLMDHSMHIKKTKKKQNFEISTFNPPESLSFSVKSHSKRSLHYADLPKEGRIVNDEVEVKEDKLTIAGNILNLLKKKKGVVLLEYEDFDTDDDEDLDITPEWKKNREVFLSEFEDQHKPSKKLICIPIMRGQQRGAKKNFFSIDKPEEPTKFALMKCLFIDPLNPNAISKVEELKKLLRERSYFIRTYITRGKNIGGEGSSLDSYIVFKLGDKVVSMKDKTLCEGTNNPDYYVQFDIECKLPGSALLEVQVWSDVFGADDMIGKTTIDMENRLFTGKWLKYERKPFENRNIFPEGETISKGNLEMWVELIPKSLIRQTPPLAITRPLRHECEIRVIVWETKDCVFKDEAEQCNDIYVRVGLQNKPNDAQETDIHWRCRSNGSFNWRMKFKSTYPLNNDEYGGDKLFVQLLDKDLVAADDIIGSCVVDLNQHKMIDKCLKRQQSVPLQMRELNRKAKISDKIWYQVYNPLIRDKANKPIMQGQVCLSIEIMPLKIAGEKQNGFGRDSPNNFPPLDEPTGRMKFDLLHPLDFIKTIIGPALYKKVCYSILGAFCFLICISVGWILVSQIIATAITN